jgi:putative ABC transport system permease protein
LVIEGRPPVSRADSPNGRYRVVTPRYFETMKISVRAGRIFNEQDRVGSLAVVMINETMARTYFPNEGPIGKRIQLIGEKDWFQIIGISGDVKHYGLGLPARPELYLAQSQNPESFLSVLVRGNGDPSALIPEIRRQVASLDKNQPIMRVRTGEQLIASSVAQPRFYSTVMFVFSMLALVLASCGIYGVISYGVAQRTREFGIRMALGAKASDVLGRVLREGMLLGLIGVGAGVAASLALSQLVSKLLFGVAPTDPATFLVAPAVLVVVAALASYIPARRATRIDPAIALRDE